MAEGIEYRLKEQMERLPSTADFDQWLKAVKTVKFHIYAFVTLSLCLTIRPNPC